MFTHQVLPLIISVSAASIPEMYQPVYKQRLNMPNLVSVHFLTKGTEFIQKKYNKVVHQNLIIVLGQNLNIGITMHPDREWKKKGYIFWYSCVIYTQLYQN